VMVNCGDGEAGKLYFGASRRNHFPGPARTSCRFLLHHLELSSSTTQNKSLSKTGDWLYTWIMVIQILFGSLSRFSRSTIEIDLGESQFKSYRFLRFVASDLKQHAPMGVTHQFQRAVVSLFHTKDMSLLSTSKSSRRLKIFLRDSISVSSDIAH
jgi:hypothetical protein